jgi:hypothetical protein
VEIRGLTVTAIAKRKNVNSPVLEKYVFTPYVEAAHLDLHTALSVCTQIIVENKPGTRVNVVEVHKQGTAPLSPVLVPIFADMPLIKASGIL